MKISFITTILNEGESIKTFLDSILSQSKKPDELIIVDGKSTDKTVYRIKNYELRIKREGIVFKLIVKRGNRSVGRNAAIESSTGDIIVCSDAGCELDKNWIKNITKPFKDPRVDVVAGYYKGKPKTIFQKCLIPYVLVMPDRVDHDNFLPATRSMAFKKSIWKDIGGFNEKLSHNEDYAFAQKLKRKFSIKFERNAIVFWQPPNNLFKIFIMFFRFAYGDIQSGLVRPKVIFIFLRYIVGVLLIFMAIINISVSMITFLIALIICYATWAIIKNYHYVKDQRAYVYLPLLQLTSDLAVISGSFFAFIRYGIQK